LTWIAGQPQPREGAGWVSVPLGGRQVAALRVRPAPPRGPWSLAEVLLHAPGPDPHEPDGTQPLDAGRPWAERRRELVARPRPDRAEWYWRLAIAARNP
jgi:hypothetical protein